MNEAKYRILLVDDEPDLVEYMSRRLIKKGHRVVGVTSGPAALEQVQEQTFDICVLDLKMPGMDGIEVLKQLKEAQPFLQVVMLTGHGSIDSALESGRHDAFRFLVKPYEFESLLVTLDEAYQQKRKDQKEGYLEAINDLNVHTSSAHEIIHETRRLRAFFEQE